MSLIGFNVAQDQVKDWPRFISHLNKTRPVWCLTFGSDSANALRKAGVKNVAVRIYNGEQNVAGRMNATDLMNRFQGVAVDGHWCELTNEVGLQTTWLKTVLPTMLARGFKVTAPALSSGTPEPTDYAGIRGLVEIAAQYPDSFRFSVHEYINFIPFNMQARYYSPSMPLPARPWYYEGRLESFLYPYCDQWGLPRPKYVITELGIAAQNGAQNAPTASNGYPGANGWYSIARWLETQYPGYSAAQTYAKMITTLARVLYGRPESTCEGIAVYCLGADWNRPKGSQEDWSGFDLEAGNSVGTFYSEFEAYAMSSTPIHWQPRLLTIAKGTSVNLRAQPTTKSAIVQEVSAGTYPVNLDADFNVLSDGYHFIHIQLAGKEGFMASELVTVIEVPDVSPEQLLDWNAVQQAAQSILSIASKYN